MAWSWRIRKPRLGRRHTRFAASEKYLSPKDAIPKNRFEAIDAIVRIFRKEGIRERVRQEGTNWSKWTTTLPWCVYFGSNWDSLEPWKQAEIRYHEYVHVRQQRAAKLSFFLRYANAKWRAAYEAQAYRMNIRCRARWGFTTPQLRSHCSYLARHIYFSYRLGRLDQSSTIREIEKVLLLEVP